MKPRRIPSFVTELFVVEQISCSANVLGKGSFFSAPLRAWNWNQLPNVKSSRARQLTLRCFIPWKTSRFSFFRRGNDDSVNKSKRDDCSCKSTSESDNVWSDWNPPVMTLEGSNLTPASRFRDFNLKTRKE